MRLVPLAHLFAMTFALTPVVAQMPPPAAGTPAQSTPAPATPAADPRLAGIPLFPGAQLLASYDAGRGQQQFLYGTNTPYADVVAFYRTQMKSNGRELFRTPPMQQFDLARFQESTMAYQPSVVVKDYGYLDAPGYLHVTGTTETRYKTIIQIVPAAK
jgi:hypothetical protein